MAPLTTIPKGPTGIPCKLLNCPVGDNGLCRHCGWRGAPNCIIEVCRYCYSPNLLEADHGVTVSDGTPEGGDIGCMWLACRHQVGLMETQCSACHPAKENPW